MTPVKTTIKLGGILLFAIFSLNFRTVCCGKIFCESAHQCGSENRDNSKDLTLLSSEGQPVGEFYNNVLEVKEGANQAGSGTDSSTSLEPAQVKLLFDSDPLLASLSASIRAALLNLQMKLWQYSNETIVFILVLVTVILVIGAAVLAFLLGPFITAIVSLILPFVVIGALLLPSLLQPVVAAPVPAAILG